MLKCLFSRGVLILLTASVVCALPVSSHAIVTFERTYGGPAGDAALCVDETSDGGFILAGRTSSFGAGREDMYVIRTDSKGDTLWSVVWGDSDWNTATSVEQTADNGYLVAGYSFLSTPVDIDVLRLDPSGGLLWNRKYVGGYMQANHTVGETVDGGCFVFGESSDKKFYLLKMDSVGDSMWARCYEGLGWARGLCARHTPDGGYILGGDTWRSGAPEVDAYIVMADSLGNACWQRLYGGSGSEQALSVNLTSDGGYIISIWSDSLGPNYWDNALVKMGSDGAVEWERWFGGSGRDGIWCVQQTKDGGYIMAGETESYGAGSRDVWLIKTDSVGYVLWMRTYGGADSDGARSVQETSDGGYIVVGETESFGPGYRAVYLIKTDQYGHVNSCDPVEPWEPRTQGYWRRQCKHDPMEDICAYVDSVHIVADLFDQFDCDSVCDLLNVDAPENDMCRKARRQFMALLLNIASGKLAVCNCLEDGREVGDVIAEIDSLLSNDPEFYTCERAKTLADDINNGIGIVPCDTTWTQAPPKAVRLPSISVVPNPFSKSTAIEYEVKAAGHVRLDIYDKTGRLVRTVVDNDQMAGLHQIEWDGLDQSGQEVPQGIYFSRMQVGDSVMSGKFILFR